MLLLRKPVVLATLMLSTGFAGGAWAAPATGADIKALVAIVDATNQWIASVGSVETKDNQLVLRDLKIETRDHVLRFSAHEITLTAADISLLRVTFGSLDIAGLALNLNLENDKEFELLVPRLTGGKTSVPTFADWHMNKTTPMMSFAGALSRVASIEFDTLDAAESIFRTYYNRPPDDSSRLPVVPKPEARTLLSAGTALGFHIGPMTGGNLASVTLGKTALKVFPVSSSADAAEVSGNKSTEILGFETLSVDDINIANMVAIYDPAAYIGGKGDAAWKSGIKSVSIKNYTSTNSLSGKEGEIGAIDTIALGPLSVRQTAVPLAEAVDIWLNTHNFDKPLSAGDADSFGTQILPLFHTWRLESAQASGLSATNNSTAEKLSLDSIGIQGLSADGLEGFALNTLALNFSVQKGGKDVAFNLASFEVKDVKWPSVVAWLKLGTRYVGLSSMIMADQMRGLLGIDPIQILPSVASITLNDVTLTLDTVQAFALKQIQSTTDTIEGEKSSITQKGRMDGLYLGAPLLALEPDIKAAIEDLGYSELHFNGNTDFQYDIGSTGNMRTTYNLIGKETGALVLSYGIDGLTAPRLVKWLAMMNKIAATPDKPDDKPDPAKDRENLLDGLGFAPFLFRFEDASLTGRIFSLFEKRQKTDHATMVANASAMATLAITQIDDAKFSEEASKAVSDFLNNPKSISIRMNPPAPVMWQEIVRLGQTTPATAEAIGKLIDLVGLHITAND